MAKNKRESKKKPLQEAKSTNEPHLKSTPDVLITRTEKSTNRNFQKIFIFCEGETEENYFKGIGDSETLKKFRRPPIKVTVLQRPKSGNEGIYLLLGALNELNIRTQSHKVEDKFEPELDKIWVVFDADEKEAEIAPLFDATKEAREELLAKDANCAKVFDKFYRHINIAFSNRAFEHWVLLHFERNCTLFPKTECKTKKQPHGCGKLHRDTDESQYTDCKGSTCTVGYLRHTKYHPNYKKGDWRKSNNKDQKDTSYCYEGLTDSSRLGDLAQEKLAFQKMRNAIENAQYLRQMVGDKRPYTNPYTDINHLVGTIIDYQPIIYWAKWNDWKTVGDKDKSHHFCVRLTQSSSEIKFTIEQKHTKSLLLNKNTVQVGVFYNDAHFYRYCKILPTNIVVKLLRENETITLSLPLPFDVLLNTVYHNPTYCLRIGDNINIWLSLSDNKDSTDTI